jgi:membrane protein YdbS with pleckstrin-like domain
MSPAELKVLVVSPSIKNWPVVLGIALLVTLTGLLGLVLLILNFQEATLILAVGMGILVGPALQTANAEYWVTNVRVVERGGIFTKTETGLALSEIKEMKITRNKLQKAFGVGNLEITSAAGSMTLAGVEDPEMIRDKILTLK